MFTELSDIPNEILFKHGKVIIPDKNISIIKERDNFVKICENKFIKANEDVDDHIKIIKNLEEEFNKIKQNIIEEKKQLKILENNRYIQLNLLQQAKYDVKEIIEKRCYLCWSKNPDHIKIPSSISIYQCENELECKIRKDNINKSLDILGCSFCSEYTRQFVQDKFYKNIICQVCKREINNPLLFANFFKEKVEELEYK